jgi:hypothetical protein
MMSKLRKGTCHCEAIACHGGREHDGKMAVEISIVLLHRTFRLWRELSLAGLSCSLCGKIGETRFSTGRLTAEPCDLP